MQAVDGAVLDAWSRALVTRLNLAHTGEYLWNGVGFDATKSAQVWLCLPSHGALFAVEFKVPFQTLRVRVTSVNDMEVEEEEGNINLLVEAQHPALKIERCELGPGDKAGLKRVLRWSRTLKSLPKMDVDSERVNGSLHLERIRAYLSSLPQFGAG